MTHIKLAATLSLKSHLEKKVPCLRERKTKITKKKKPSRKTGIKLTKETINNNKEEVRRFLLGLLYCS
jgi:putative cell wall-binding protein